MDKAAVDSLLPKCYISSLLSFLLLFTKLFVDMKRHMHDKRLLSVCYFFSLGAVFLCKCGNEQPCISECGGVGRNVCDI